MRRRKFLAGVGAWGALPALGQAKGQSPAPERHSDLPPGITPSAFANTKTYFSPFTIMEDFHLLGQQFSVGYAEPFHYIGPDARYLNRIHEAALKEAVDL